MSSSEKPTARPAGHAPEAVGRARKELSGEQPFDKWLHKQLHEIYDEIASEPLPDDILGDHDAASDATGRPAASSKPQ